MQKVFLLKFLVLVSAMSMLILPHYCAVSAQAAYAQNVSPLTRLIPASATVLTLTGLNFNLINYMPEVFHGRFSRSPYRMYQVRYPASISPQTITKGVAALDAALRSTPGPIIVLAHSQGAQVASHWMRQHANDSSAPPPSRVTFILLGNPLRACGGRGIGQREFGGTIGKPTPTTTPWTVIDVARRYDGWADWPTDENNQLAVKNANIGRRVYHIHYDEVELFDPAHTVWQNGNTTFVLTHETLTLFRGLSQPPGWAERAASAYVESAYNRPSNDPRISPLPIQKGDTLWYWKLRRWGVPL
ncbi:MAG: PE-PPE domain-containing protein [Candidatus Melainabacteria bacterium]|nr:MAG: PE-PPE domain-containing protein [Candidatus Melainabacteria bacterium]